MKKKLFIAVLFITIASIFSDPKYHNDNQIILDTMYINSVEGLRVRDNQSLSGKTICILPHRLPVKITSIGDESIVDDISASWVKICLPECYQKNGIKYGWVFSGYLSVVKPEFSTEGWLKVQVEQFLENNLWYFERDYGPYAILGVCSFNKGIFSGLFFPDDDMFSINYSVVDSKVIKFEKLYYGSSTNSDLLIDYGPMEIVFTDSAFYEPGHRRSNGMAWFVSFGLEDHYSTSSSEQYFLKEIKKNLRIYSELYDYQSKKTYNILQWMENKNISNNEIVEYAIKSGVNAVGTKWSKQYRDYWGVISMEKSNPK